VTRNAGVLSWAVVFVSLAGCLCGPGPDRDLCVTGNGFCTPDGGASNCRTLCTVACTNSDVVAPCSQGCVVEQVPTSDRSGFLAARSLQFVSSSSTEVASCRERLPVSGRDGGP
jgi:hypothetical protein